MKKWRLLIALVAPLSLVGLAFAEDPVFSGPQVGEPLPPFKATVAFGESAGKEVDLVKQADGKPILLVFMHQRTRPGFGLMNALMNFAVTRAKQGLVSGVVLLTDDPTKTLEWTRVARRNFAEGAMFCISHEGHEGPGAYGLNRNMDLTILVGKEGKVTANFALVQPSLQADGPKIIQAIADVTGGGKVPSIAELDATGYGGNMAMRQGEDPRLRELLRPVINRSATAEQVDSAIKALEKYVAENEKARKELGRIAATIVDAGKVDNYGTKPAQEALRKWARELGRSARERNDAKEKDKESAAGEK